MVQKFSAYFVLPAPKNHIHVVRSAADMFFNHMFSSYLSTYIYLAMCLPVYCPKSKSIIYGKFGFSDNMWNSLSLAK